jgi:putative flippase GtrA
LNLLRRLFWFAGIGGAATLAYAALAWAMTVPLGWPAALAYSACAAAGFISHKRLTFASTAPAKGEMKRFAVTSAVGYGLAAGLPYLLTETLHYDPRVAIFAVCVLCPAVNFILLSAFVFAKPDTLRQSA